MKKKKCRVCKTEFNQFSTTQIVCTYVCAYEYAKSETIKKNKKYDLDRKIDTKRRKEALKSKADWFREAQTAFNAYIRERDRGKPCCSCDKPDNGQHQRHASHYRSVKACSVLRFNTFNVHASCAQCNTMLSGNLLEYRIRLVNKIGPDRVSWLECQNDIIRYDIDYIKRLKQIFNRRTRLLKSIKN